MEQAGDGSGGTCAVSAGIHGGYGVERKLHDLDDLFGGGLEGKSSPWLDLGSGETEGDVAEARGIDGRADHAALAVTFEEGRAGFEGRGA